MSGVNRHRRLQFCAEKFRHHFAETITAIAHRQEFQRIAWLSLEPATRNGFSRSLCRQRAFEFVWNDEDFDVLKV